MNTETITPKTKYSRSGTIMNQIKDEASSESNHINDEKINRIILIGESEIVKTNIETGMENASNAHPKNSATVIVISKRYLF